MFDWNQQPASPAPAPVGTPAVRFGQFAASARVVDETLRDGLQSSSTHNPPVEWKIDLLHAMAAVGVDVVSVGLPAAGALHEEHCYRLCREIQDARLPLIPTAAARTVVSDVTGIARASQRAGMPIEVYAFIGSSPIRHEVESWSLSFLVDAIRGAAIEARKNDLPFCLVTEDTTRSHPDALRALFKAAIDEGASRLCLCDTTGHVTPYGVEGLVSFVREELEKSGSKNVELDWHAHNDRGLGLQTALWAASLGVERVHGTGLGIGERVGNTPLELLVDNLGRLGARPVVAREQLIAYCDLAARALSWAIPVDHPIAGSRTRMATAAPRSYRYTASDAGSTSTGAHAEADKFADEPLVPMRLVHGDTVHRLAVPARRTLLEALRYDLDLVGSKQGCDKGDCGACTVVLNGRAVLSCLTLALEADGADVQTVELLQGAPHIDPILDCFDRHGGGQCGFCTPGMLMSATALLGKNPSPTRDQIKVAISGNLCRCTGYGRIVDAIDEAAAMYREGISGASPDDAGRAKVLEQSFHHSGTTADIRPPVGDMPLPGDECSPPPLTSNAAKQSRGEKPTGGKPGGGQVAGPKPDAN